MRKTALFLAFLLAVETLFPQTAFAAEVSNNTVVEEQLEETSESLEEIEETTEEEESEPEETVEEETESDEENIPEEADEEVLEETDETLTETDETEVMLETKAESSDGMQVMSDVFQGGDGDFYLGVMIDKSVLEEANAEDRYAQVLIYLLDNGEETDISAGNTSIIYEDESRKVFCDNKG